MKKPTIYEALATKLGRNPSNEECKIEIFRILEEGKAERMSRGKS